VGEAASFPALTRTSVEKRKARLATRPLLGKPRHHSAISSDVRKTAALSVDTFALLKGKTWLTRGLLVAIPIAHEIPTNMRVLTGITPVALTALKCKAETRIGAILSRGHLIWHGITLSFIHGVAEPASISSVTLTPEESVTDVGLLTYTRDNTVIKISHITLTKKHEQYTYRASCFLSKLRFNKFL
jgi:hypothetical protein